MVRYRYIVTILTFLAFACTLSAAKNEKKFANVLAIKGVAKVEYNAPFLLIQIRDSVDFKRLRNEVSAILTDKSDPDIAAIKGPIRTQFLDSRTFRMNRAMLIRIKAVDSAKKLRLLYASLGHTSIIELDWNAEEITTTRKLYSKSNFWSSPNTLNQQKETIFKFIDKLKENEKKPERLICMSSSFGTLIYPVYNGQIKTNTILIPYVDFEPALK